MSTIDMDMTSDPVEFAEAVEEFAARRVVTREEADKLEAYARKRAWWISGVAQMDVVNDVHESIVEAMRKGTPFEDWKKEQRQKIENAWGRKDSFRIQTIFRNATSSAYNAGRLDQMSEPHIVAVRPFWMLDVVDDARTSDICVKFIEPPVILPADDPRWLRLSPPFHHRCRTGKRSLRRSVAEKKGITTELPDIEIQDGWGIDPRVAEPPKPSQRDTQPDPELVVECMVKGGKDYRNRKPVKIKQNPKLTPEHWVSRYREKYGEAAEQVGYGRMVHERAKEMSDAEALELLDGLLKKRVHGIPYSAEQFLAKATRKKRPEPIPEYAKPAVEAGKLLAQLSKLAGRSRPGAVSVAPEVEKSFDAAASWYASLSSEKLEIPLLKWRQSKGELGNRSYFDDVRGEIALAAGRGVGTAVHELAHGIEMHGKVGAKIAAFRKVREAGQSPRKLSEITGNPAYGNEVTIEDEYWHPYMGKSYNSVNSSEIISQLFGDMADGCTQHILDKDPESLYFAIGVLLGA
jgi:SPP1 gp7 family putative phage head morphogenesis protein